MHIYFPKVLSGLKQKIDAALLPEEASLLVEARTWFITRLIIPRFNPSRPRTPSTASSPDTSLIRGEGECLTSQKKYPINMVFIIGVKT